MKRTIDEIKSEASKYNHKVDFKNESNACYQEALRYDRIQPGTMAEICDHMTPKGTWYKKLVYRYDFMNKTVYFGITNDRQVRINEHKVKGAVYDYSISSEETPIYSEVTDYIDKKDALIMERNLIKEYREMGWNVLNKTNGGENGGGEEFWTKDKVIAEAKKYKYRWEFGENSGVAYSKAKKRGWDEAFFHMEDKLIDWDEEKIINAAKDSGLDLITEFSKEYSGAYHAAERLGIKQKLQDLFEWKGGKFWTKEEIKEIASKYTARSKFNKEHHNACVYSQKKGWYDDITSHMGYLPKGKKWTKEEVHEEAKKYKTRNEFARSSDTKGKNKAYQSASHNGWLDEVCSHMTVGKGGKIGKRKK
jgi:predicted GIY-YIG superfamily endonuclease